MSKILPQLVEIILFLFLSGTMSLLSIKIFNVNLNLKSKPGLRNAALIIIGAVGLWLTVTPFIQINFNLYQSDLRALIDRTTPISVRDLPIVKTQLSRDGETYTVDLTNNCNYFTGSDQALIANEEVHLESSYFGLLRSETINIDNDISDERVVTFFCGSNSQYIFAHIFDGEKVYEIDIGPVGSELTFQNGEIKVSVPGGGPRCCPTVVQSRYFHFRNGRLIEHRQPTEEVF